MELMFGIGALWGTRTDLAGYGPDQFAILQENTVEFNFEVKELYSQLGFPVDIARGKGKVTGKSKMARVFGALYADLFFGETVGTAGVNNVSESEAATLSAGTPTYTVANSAAFLTDLGVYYTSTGQKAFSFTTGAPSTGVYAVNTSTGVYSFAAGDAGAGILVSYVYSQNTGKIFTINNHFMGYTPNFMATFYTSKNTQNATGQLTLRLNLCISSRLTFPSRIDDYNIPDFDWQAFSNAANQIGTLSTTE